MNEKLKSKDVLRIDEILQSKKISKKEFADKLKVNRQTLYSFLNRNITLETVLKIADTLEVQPWQLFTSSSAAGSESVLNGFVEYKGTIHRIQSIQDLQNLLTLIDNQNE